MTPKVTVAWNVGYRVKSIFNKYSFCLPPFTFSISSDILNAYSRHVTIYDVSTILNTVLTMKSFFKTLKYDEVYLCEYETL